VIVTVRPPGRPTLLVRAVDGILGTLKLERGLHLPSVRVLKLLSEALNVSAETLLAQAGLLDLAPSGDGAAAAGGPPSSPVESAISAEERLADEQKAALIAVYRSMLRS
jgi:hypothetical protein